MFNKHRTPRILNSCNSNISYTVASERKQLDAWIDGLIGAKTPQRDINGQLWEIRQ